LSAIGNLSTEDKNLFPYLHLLLENGADPNLKGTDGRSFKDMVDNSNDEELKMILAKHLASRTDHSTTTTSAINPDTSTYRKTK